MSGVENPVLSQERYRNTCESGMTYSTIKKI